MTTITHEMVWTVDNVKTFRGYDVTNGEIDISYEEYRSYLDDIYGQVMVCGQIFSSGSLLEDADPTSFRCGLGDLEDEMQSALEEAIEKEDDSDIVWDEYDPCDITDDESAEDDE